MTFFEELRKIVNDAATEEMRVITRTAFTELIVTKNPDAVIANWCSGISRCVTSRSKLNSEIDRMGGRP